MSTETWTNVVIGSGEGGKYLAWHLASLGQKTAVVERRWVGGSCPNTNCLPAKNEIQSAKVARLAGQAADFGVNRGPVSIDMGGVRGRKRAMVDGLVAMHLEKYKASGAELIMGSAHFLDSRTIEVSLNSGRNRTIVAERFFLNLGTHASIPAIAGLQESSPLTHIEVLELDRLPAHLAVIGGGYVGLEFAQAYRRFGSSVTILQRGPQLLENQDADVAEEVRRFLSTEGVDIINCADALEVSGRSGSEVTIRFRTQQGERTISASDILVAAGRTPNTNDAGLKAAGVRVDSSGYIVVNDRLETTAPNIWAIGECAGSPQFTHASFDDFRVIRENLAGNYRSTRGRLMPSCLFTDPQVAHIGLMEKEARGAGLEFQVAKIPMASVLRTRTLSETEGFMKALVSEADGRVLGFTMVGAEAGEVMAVMQTAMQAGLPCTFLRDSIFAHPTMAEGLNVLFSSVNLQKRVRSHAWPTISRRGVKVDGINIFYREAGPPEAPVVLLLHGFPTSSFQYRELIPRLADRYRVIAPDLPGFGFTEVPDDRAYVYTFDALAKTVGQFTDALQLSRYALYVFDYGAPTGFRLAVARPERVTAIVSQNGNAYEEGLGDAWAPIRRYWTTPSKENREAIRTVLNAEGMKREYSSGMADPSLISPESFTLDAALLARPGNVDIQLDLFLDYANNVRLYPTFHEYFRKWTPPLLAIWGKHDPYFVPAGAEAFRRDNPNAVARFLDTGHFALETHVNEVAEAMHHFLRANIIEAGDARAATPHAASTAR